MNWVIVKLRKAFGESARVARLAGTALLLLSGCLRNGNHEGAQRPVLR